MRYQVRHTTRFRYGEPVFLEPHTSRLRPRCDSAQRLTRYHLDFDPEPSVLSETKDAEGNDVTHAWFAGMTAALTVRSEFEVETLRDNPFQYLLLDEAAMRVPVTYPDAIRAQLEASLAPVGSASDRLQAFVQPVAAQANGETLPFLTALTGKIRDTHSVIVREHGDPLEPEETLLRREGACRDLAVLFMDCCRSLGIATRFVSGYQDAGRDSASNHMHAWAEVYLPGAGWRGYDPSQGLAVADRHIAVAASAVPRLAAPIYGTYRGEAKAEPLQAEITFVASESADLVGMAS